MLCISHCHETKSRVTRSPRLALDLFDDCVLFIVAQRHTRLGRRPQSAAAMADAVSYDGATFLIRGERVLLLVGSVHYPRVHPSRWPAIFASCRAARLNTIETYVFWGEHTDSPSCTPESSYDFSGRRDLFGFLAAAASADLHAILRIGPYVCAEVSYGGFPFALRDAPGMRFRTLNEPFMASVATWLRTLAKELHARKLLAPAGGPVILAQLENEYKMISDSYGDDGRRYLQWCSDMQHEMRLGVPTIMCFGAADGAVETINAFYAHKALPALRSGARRPQPAMWTECWTGWYDVWGAPHHRRPATDLAYAVARYYAAGGGGHCYYMWQGGTNFGRTPMYLQATTYDYDAPIDEFYLPTTKARHVAALHEVLLERYAPALFSIGNAGGEVAFPPAVELACAGVCCYSWSEQLMFICNDSDSTVSEGELGEILELAGGGLKALAPLSVRIVDPSNAGAILFDSAVIAEHDVVPRARESAETSPARGSWKWLQRPEPLPVAPPLSRRQETGDFPPEQLSLTNDRSDYCFYSATFKWNSRELAAVALSRGVLFRMEACDFVYVFVNGSFVGSSVEPLWEDRKNNPFQSVPDPPAFLHRVKGALPSSHALLDDLTFNVTILVCALGLVKGDWQLGDGPSANMLEEKKGLLSQVSIVTQCNGDGGGGGNLGGQDGSLDVASRESPWTAVAGLEGEARGWADNLTASGSPDSSIEAGPYSGEAGKEEDNAQLVWYETSVEPVSLSNSWVLDLGSMGKGLLWVNGEFLGRYWDVPGTRPRCGFLKGSPVVQDEPGPPTQRYYHVPPWVCQVDSEGKPSRLRISLFEERGYTADPRGVSLLCVV